LRTTGGAQLSAYASYSGVLIIALAASITVLGLFFWMRTEGTYRFGQRSTQPPKGDVHAQPIDQSFDERILEYITSNKGTISLTKASKDLEIQADLIKDAIDRSKRDGRLEPA